MRTLQPVIAPGTTEWDQALFTPAEFQARLARLQAFVAAQGWAGAVLYGDAEGASLFSWITGFFPRIRWSMALVPAVGGDLRLLLGVAPRDLSFARELTWLSDPATYDKLPAVLPGWLEGLGPGRTLGLAGRDHIPFETYDRLRALSPGWTLEPADAATAGLWRSHSAAERAAIGACADLIGTVGSTLKAMLDADVDLRVAAIRAEKLGYRSGAHDIRFLLSPDAGRTFYPVQAGMPPADGPCAVYLALRCAGYWADAIFSLDSAADEAVGASALLDRALELLKPGASRAGIEMALAGAGADLGGAAATLSRVGLELTAFASETPLEAGTVVSVRVRTPGSAPGQAHFASALAIPGAGGGHVLFDTRGLQAL